MTNQETNVTNSAESTLSSALALGATTANVTDTSDFPAAPFYVAIDPDLDAKREVVLATAKTGTTLTITRGQDGTSDVAHDSGAIIAAVPVAALWTDINDRVEGHTHSGGTDGTAIATSDLTGHTEAAHTALNLLSATTHDSHDHTPALGTATFSDLSDGADLFDMVRMEMHGDDLTAVDISTGTSTSPVTLATNTFTPPTSWSGYDLQAISVCTIRNAGISQTTGIRVSINGAAGAYTTDGFNDDYRVMGASHSATGLTTAVDVVAEVYGTQGSALSVATWIFARRTS